MFFESLNSLSQILLTLVSGSMLIYFFIVLFMYLGQRKFLYHKNDVQPQPKDYGLGQSTEVVYIPTFDGLLLYSWYCKPKDTEKPFILFFHGNAGHIGDRADWLRFFRDQGYGFLIPSYRYNAGNSGYPNEENLLKDGQFAINWILAQGVKAENLVLYGESLGSGLAISLGQNNISHSVIIEGGYSSITDVARHKYPFLPVSYLLKDRFSNSDYIENVMAPVLILHGAKDRTVLLDFAQKLYRHGNPEKDKIVIFPDGNHVDLKEHGADLEILSFLKR